MDFFVGLNASMQHAMYSLGIGFALMAGTMLLFVALGASMHHEGR